MVTLSQRNWNGSDYSVGRVDKTIIEYIDDTLLTKYDVHLLDTRLATRS